MQRETRTQLELFPFTTLGLAAQRVVEGLVDTQPVRGRAEKHGHDDDPDHERDVHQPIPFVHAQFCALEAVPAAQRTFKRRRGLPRSLPAPVRRVPM